MRVFPLIAVTLAVTFGLFAVETKPAKNAGWPSFRQNPMLSGIAAAELPAKLVLLWETPVGDQHSHIIGIHEFRVVIGIVLVCQFLYEGLMWLMQILPAIPEERNAAVGPEDTHHLRKRSLAMHPMKPLRNRNQIADPAF